MRVRGGLLNYRNLLTPLRRVLLLWLFMFWQGGFLFYASVVVPVGTEILGEAGQGDITRQVTVWLNIIGAIVLLAWIVDLVSERDSLLAFRWSVWILLGALLVWLVFLHADMSANLDLETRSAGARAAFRTLHRWYLWISSVQWGLGIAFTLLTLQNWREGDRRAGAE